MTFRPLNSQNSTQSNYSQVNNMVRTLNKEQTVKTFKQSGGNNAIINGRLPWGGYGILLYDSDGIPSVLIGQAPDDSRMGIWQAKPGQNVVTLLGG